MLKLTVTIVPEQWDSKNRRFIPPKEKTLQLEHSLVSLSKWESRWHKPFLSKETKTTEETIDYIKCMTITQNVDPDVYNHLSNQNIIDVNNYLEDSMTATTFSEDKFGKKNNEIVTAEIIDYWMLTLHIPAEYRKWHLNKLIALIRVCSIKNQPPGKKRSEKDIASYYAYLNKKRKEELLKKKGQGDSNG